MGGEPLAKFGIKICDLSVSQLILFKEQSPPGRVIVAYKDHVSEMVNISDEDRNAYGDGGCHLHFHLVPKYKSDEFEWGTPFAMNPGRKYLTEEEYAAMIQKIKDNL